MQRNSNMTLRTIRKHAKANGHDLMPFKPRLFAPMWQPPRYLYHLAYCRKCGCAVFSNDENHGPAFRTCRKS